MVCNFCHNKGHREIESYKKKCNGVQEIDNILFLEVEGKRIIITVEKMRMGITMERDFIVSLVLIRVNLVEIEMIILEKCALEMVQMAYLLNRSIEEFLQLTQRKPSKLQTSLQVRLSFILYLLTYCLIRELRVLFLLNLV